MSRQLKAFHWSIAIHMMMALAVFTTGKMLTATIKVNLIDLSLINMEDIEPDRAISPTSRKSKKITTKQPGNPFLQPLRKSSNRKVKPLTTQTMSNATTLSPLSPALPQQHEQQVENTATTSPIAPGMGALTRFHAKNNAQPSAGQAKTAGLLGKIGVIAASKREQYLAQHFIYIRDQIMSHLSYPAIARKKGWSGRVKLSFRIIEDGTVEAITVVASSGFPILDRHAVATVNKVAPFPRPPERADITIPITYALRN
jgi:protein TonB